ncbi:FtsK/SpoIIIE domain-containing protein [Glutamicibacter ardleyensis]|uniref:FtsK/SpoIIIE domain-containing protein n=1 Tax=Glutamicibacter ardleyensis TaxID=225894 RepID=UPI003FD079BD
MSSTDLKKLARSIQQTSGSNYTEALREAKRQIEENRQKVLGGLAVSEQPEFQIQFETFPYEPGTLDSTLYFGIRKNGRNAVVNFDKESNLLCVGTTGSGKTEFLKNLIFSALRLDAYYEVSAISLKSAHDLEFARPYATSVATNLQDALALLRALHRQAVERTEIREMYGASSFLLLPDEGLIKENLSPRRHILFIDELFELLNPAEVPATSSLPDAVGARKRIAEENAWRAEIRRLLAQIISVGDSAGISIVAGSQSLTSVHRALEELPVNSSLMVMGHLRADEARAFKISSTALPAYSTPMPVGRGTFISTAGKGFRSQVVALNDEQRVDRLRLANASG